jgi:hypothetical protein
MRVEASWPIFSVLPARVYVPEMRLQPPEPLTRPLLRSNCTCASLPGAMGSSPSCASRQAGPSIGSSRLMPLPQPAKPASRAAAATTGSALRQVRRVKCARLSKERMAGLSFLAICNKLNRA